MKKIVLVVCDGLGDRPSASLGGKTPLQAAKKPFLDSIAREAMAGLLYTISPGIVPGSDTSHLSLLGYDPRESYTGRGPLEAVGAGIELQPGDVAFRCNFASVDEDGRVVDRRAGRIKEPDTGKLASLLSDISIDGHKLIFKESTEHRCVLVIRGSDLGDKVTDTDPGTEGKRPLKSVGKDERSQRTAGILNRFTELAIEKLSGAELNRQRIKNGEKPANAVLARGAGRYPEIEEFESRQGMSMGAIAAEGLIVGICKLLGAELKIPSGFTAGTDMQVGAVAGTASELLGSHDFLFIHVKQTDLAGHDGDAAGKVNALEKVDTMVRSLFDVAGDIVFAITGDHSTPVAAKEHTCDPVPLMIYSKGLRSDGIASFDEIACAQGSLTGLRGLELMPLLKGYADRNEKYGA